MPFTDVPSPADRIAFCYRDDLNVAQMLDAMKRWGLLPPGELFGETDFFLDSLAWIGEGQLIENGAALPAVLTFSFPPDGTHWGSVTFTAGPSNFLQALGGAFGPSNLDQGLEIVRQGIAAYRVAGLTLREVGDDGAPWGTPDPGAPFRGDIRISGLPYSGAFVGYSSYPAGGADVAINTEVFVTGNLGNNADNHRYLRNTVAHEFGHAVGLAHTVPCDNSKLMEPVLVTAIDVLALDDVRGAQRNNGDRFAGNGTHITAVNLGDLASPAPRSLRFANLSTNGSASTFAQTNEDWFRFTLGSAQTVRIGTDQRGGSYVAGRQSANCSAATMLSINAQGAGSLRLQLRTGDGSSVIASGALPSGQAQRITQFLVAGEYTVRIVDTGPNLAADQFLQLYDFFIEAGESPLPSPPLAIAGVGKRIRAGSSCYFIGDINSRATAPGASLHAQSFDWDLDADGEFEVIGVARPTRSYVSNGEYPISLRVTDSNGQSSVDTIPLTVHGASTLLAFAQPSDFPRSATTPITIYGVNLRNVRESSEVTVSGFGVHVVGIPESNPDGTALTGLSLTVQPGAPLGPRTIFIVNNDGQGIGPDLITVAPPTACPGDANGDRVIDFMDLNAVLGQFGQSGVGLVCDFNNDLRVDFLDLNIVLGNFGLQC